MWKAFLLCTVVTSAFGATDVSERVVVYSGHGAPWSVYGQSSTPSWSFLGGSSDKFWETCSCSSASSCSNPNKYLVTTLHETGGAKRLTLSVLYTARKCDLTLKAQGKCVEHISIYAKLSNAKDTPLDPDREAGYNLVANTSAVTFPAGKDFSDKTNFETHVATSDAKYILIGFLDVGFCGSISQLNISYLVCPSKSSALLEFPQTFAPASGTITVQGTCAKNSEPAGSSTGTMFCSADGKVSFNGVCVCREGFEKNGIECKACSLDHFKVEKGNQACTACGRNSLAGSLRLKCTCNVGFYRPVNYANDNARDCEQPPAQPRNLNATSISSTSAMLSWNPPQDKGTGDDILYDVVCGNCVDKTVFAENLNTTTFTLELSSYVRYNFSVISVNNVTKATGVSKRSYVIFQTEVGVPGQVRNLQWKVNSDGSITLTWEPPFAKGGPDLSYVISYGDNTKTTGKTTYTIERSTSKKTYTFEVRAKTAAGLSAPVATPKLTQEGGVPLNLVVGILVPILVLLLFAVCVVVYCWRRRHPEHLQAVRLENGGVKLPTRFKGEKQYVDPLTYQDLAEAVTDIANTLERSWLDLENIIGGGEFGDVYKGTLTKPNDNGRHVAIKTLRPGANKQARDDFLSEAAIMGQFDHENVVILEGVVVKEKPMMIVTEFMSNGSLDGFLQANDGKFTCLQLLGMARGVSSGMTYLSEMGFIHRDLAARNILVSETLKCKVADFGMSRELKMDDTYDTRGGKIPVRWTAPEAIQYKKFTTASDVWSYGILLWEVMSYGERPYWDWGNLEVLERIGSGYRLPPPMNCPKIIHDMMLSCWNKDRVKRPKFRNVRDTIDKWIRNPDLLNQEESVVVKRDEHLNYASMKTIKEWLDSIKMGQYTKNFIEGGFATPRQILTLTEPELGDLGINVIGHRRKIFKSIQATKRQMEHPPLLERQNSLPI